MTPRLAKLKNTTYYNQTRRYDNERIHHEKSSLYTSHLFTYVSLWLF